MAVEAHAAFFDRLVALVPPKYYLHTDTDRVNLRYEKKAVRVEAKAAFKAQYKAAKLAKMDPDQAPTTLDLQRQLQAGAQDRASGAVPSTPVPDKEPAKQPRSPTAAPEAGRASGATLTFADGAWRPAAPRAMCAVCVWDEALGTQQPQFAYPECPPCSLPVCACACVHTCVFPEGTAPEAPHCPPPAGQPPSREELRERLQKKLEVRDLLLDGDRAWLGKPPPARGHVRMHRAFDDCGS